MRNVLLALITLTLLALPAQGFASIAYGSINNFDAVNDTGQECHGFEIEIEGCHSTDVTYTYDYNHYGTPRITEDRTDPAHPKCLIRYESKKNADGSWAAYTAIPAGPINATDGHQFTNPSINFGGEHFGVGFYGAPTAIKYSWLVDDGYGNLTFGGAVNISTPTFNYFPPVGNNPAQVQAVIVAPPAVQQVREFGEASWVKVTTTQTHNNHKVELRDLVSDDPDDPTEHNWKNGEPDEVEVEWQLMQEEFGQDNGGANGELEGAPEDLQHGDEVITRRYDFYKYTGPIDAETGEAKADNVGPDGIHGVGTTTMGDGDVVIDLANWEVVGDYIGAQMAGFDAAGQIGLIDHLQDGVLGEEYVYRTVVVGGTAPIVTTLTGALPAGMDFNTATGVLSGTPEEMGVFNFSVHSADAAGGDVTQEYTLTIGDGIPVPPHSIIATSVSHDDRGFTLGDGDYDNGTYVAVEAIANPGYSFLSWTENGVVVSYDAYFEFIVDTNHTLVANFGIAGKFELILEASPQEGGTVTGGGLYDIGAYVVIDAVANPGWQFVNWTWGDWEISADPHIEGNVDLDATLVAHFVPGHTVSITADPADGGVFYGDGGYADGSSVTVEAYANDGFHFVNWTEAGAEVSAEAIYAFDLNADRTLVAHFASDATPTYTITTSASPAIGGSTTGDGTVDSGSTATVDATPAPGYRFLNWTADGIVVSTAPGFAFTVNADADLVANFERISYTITTSASPSEGGTTAGGGTVYAGNATKVTAKVAPGYKFTGWTEDGEVVCTTAAYTFTPDGDRDLVATFALITYAVKTSSSPAAGGTTTGAGIYLKNSEVTVEALANPGYVFVNWTKGGVEVSTDPSYTFTATANNTLVAHFAHITVDITASASLGEGGSVSGDGTKNVGASVRLVATPAEGYQFAGWTEDGVVVSSTATYRFTAETGRSLVANFIPKVATVQLDLTVVGGTQTLGTVTLAAPATAGGCLVTLTSNKTTRLTVPATVLVPEGSTTVEFVADTVKTNTATNVTVTAKLGTSKATAVISVTK